jgi:hypothetical protein
MIRTSYYAEKGIVMQDSFTLAGLVLAAFLVSIPCGYLRESFKKFSLPWLFLAHLPIPLVVHFRHLAGFSWRIIPLTLGGALAGQIVGGWYKRRIHHDRKTTKRQP